MSSIHFIGGEKGGIGKSVVSRLISQYCLDYNYQYAGMDADQSHGTLTRFYPQFTQAIDLDSFESADLIVETAFKSDVNVIVDLPAQSERFLNKWMDENDVEGLLQESDINSVYWYVVDDGVDSAQLVTEFLTKYGSRIPCVVVKNYGRGSDFSILDKMLYEAGITPNKVIELPDLHTSTMHKVDKHNLNFWRAANVSEQGEDTLSMMERRRVKVWVRKAFEQIGDVMSITLNQHQ
ncbi:MAG TPA: mobilization protein MobD [Methylophaga aminisulfidivorans]|uniref:Mobilization protein MobD n=2 Tax=root TaxID=1 RepID=A0A7C2AQB7_9GAMM|nr:mobilization protein MobD [Methylophaga aminisulfidivorans]